MLTIVNKKKVYIDSRTKERIPFIARIICMTTNGSLVCFEILSSFPITSFDYNFHDTQNIGYIPSEIVKSPRICL